MSSEYLPSPERPASSADLAGEIDNIEAEIDRYRRGDLSPERFKAFRLAHGIYGQRQDGFQMVRVKIPGGHLTGRQLRGLADLSEEFSTGISHLTTRQDVQFHFARLDRVPAILRRLAEVGLTTREACANSVRNVTACPLSGFIAEEAFAAQPYALATYAFLVRNPFCQQLARKFKIAFSACPEDCAATAIHDIGAVGRVRSGAAGPTFGFRIVVGGGLGSTPMIASVLDDFVPLPELLPTVKAVLRVFADLGNRRQKMRARLKFVVHRYGIEEFRSLVARARREMTAAEVDEADLIRFVPEAWREIVLAHLAGQSPVFESDPAGSLPGAAGERPDSPAEIVPGFEAWKGCSVRAHRNPRKAVVTILVPLGDLPAAKLRILADLVTSLGGDQARIARQQNLVLPDVVLRDLPALYRALSGIGLAEAGVGTARDVTACPGADTCSLGITSSKGLSRALREALYSLGEESPELLRGISIKISGCPNSCGQHHVADIGLHGVVKTVGGRQIPAYQLHLGGRIGPKEARIAHAADKIPARWVPDAVATVLRLFRRDRREGEAFPDFVDRVTVRRLSEAIHGYAEAPPEEAGVDVDWGQSEPFTTEAIGTGECAGAGVDPAVDPFDPCREELRQAGRFAHRGQWADALANLNRSQYTLARVLLERLGKHPDSDYEVACELRAQIIDRGLASERWNEIHGEIDRLLRVRRPDPASVEGLHRHLGILLSESRLTLAAIESRKGDRSGVEVLG